MTDASILFSGGPDSTLAVLHALDTHDRVHLLTYHHALMSRMGRHSKVTDELREKFGEHRIVERETAIDEMYRKFYFRKFSDHISRYRTFYVPWLCGACKMAMHVQTIVYNMEHGISVTFDGTNIESAPYFPAQTKNYIDVMKGLYQAYGMRYETPVYDVNGTDVETEKYGLETTRETKKEHVFFSTQHSCYIGLLIHAHARLYYRPLRGKLRMQHLAGEFLEVMIRDCESLLPARRGSDRETPEKSAAPEKTAAPESNDSTGSEAVLEEK